jgi:formylglycine-generating enzyme required for sulfatase activity
VTLRGQAASWIILALALAVLPPLSAAERMKVVLDTDIGTDIDDAWALAYTLTRDDFELTAVTITDGDTSARARVASKVLFLAGRSDVPVAVGRRTPVPPERVDFQFQWAEDFTATSPTATPAADLIVAQARRHPGELVLMAVGPLQNVADALRREPRLPQLVKRLVLMSGCVYGSTWGLVAEWNVEQAIADAQLVYAAGFPLTIVPLDSTTRVVLAQDERERLRTHRTPLTTSLEALYRLWLEKPEQKMTLHDQLAIAEAARPGEFFGRMETVPLRVDEKGFTRVDPQRGQPVRVALDPRRDAFMEHYLGRLLGQSLNVPKVTRNSVGMALVAIPAGEFTMGSPEGESGRQANEGPARHIRITRAFDLGQTEVTNAQFRAFVEATGYRTDAERDVEGGFGIDFQTGRVEQQRGIDWRHPGFPGFAIRDDHPVLLVSWQDAEAFCAWLSKKEGVRYRLPTEAEWEYAARAGSTSRFSFGDDPRGLRDHANVADASLRAAMPAATRAAPWTDEAPFLAPVASYRPNAFGLHDMHGNVWEWCADGFAPGSYARGRGDDPWGPANGTFRAIRGGGWWNPPDQQRSAQRPYFNPTFRYCLLSGFRVLRER